MKILISDKIDDNGIKIFKDNGHEVDKRYDISKEDLKKDIGNYHGIVVRSATKLRADILENAKNLKTIGRAGVGLDNIDLEKAEELGIKVFNTPEAPSVSVAELALGFMFSLARHISIADETMHKGEWNKGDYLGFTLKGKKLGIVGFGSIAKELAKRAIGLEMDVGVYSRFSGGQPAIDEAKSFGCKIYPSIKDLLKDAQFISLHIPATPKTKDIINESRINLMRKDAMLINTARGDLIDEEALIKALKEDRIAGAALDVYKQEPLENEELMGIKGRLILTPHIGSQTEETQVSAATGVAKKMCEYLKKK
jgi:D-3-phosphoglycerate dehydrogenase